MSEDVSLEYHANYSSPPCVAMGEVVVCTFPVYASDSTEMPDELRHSLGRMFAASPELLAACELAEKVLSLDYTHVMVGGALLPTDGVEALDHIRAAIKKAKGGAP